MKEWRIVDIDILGPLETLLGNIHGYKYIATAICSRCERIAKICTVRWVDWSSGVANIIDNVRRYCDYEWLSGNSKISVKMRFRISNRSWSLITNVNALHLCKIPFEIYVAFGRFFTVIGGALTLDVQLCRGRISLFKLKLSACNHSCLLYKSAYLISWEHPKVIPRISVWKNRGRTFFSIITVITQNLDAKFVLFSIYWSYFWSWRKVQD